MTQELSYSFYQERQQNHVSPEQLYLDVEKVKASNKFIFQNGKWEITPYEGRAIVSMVDANPGNEIIASRLTEIKSELIDRLGDDTLYYMLPEASYHQTVANTLSATRFHRHIVDAGLKDKYPGIVAEVMASLYKSSTEQPVRMRMIGLSIFGSAMGLLGIFDNENDYKRIQKFREGIYSSPELNRLDIRRTRPFIGHITMSYLGRNPEEGERKRLVDSIIEMNQKIIKENLIFSISLTELRKYDDLSRFMRIENIAPYSFVRK